MYNIYHIIDNEEKLRNFIDWLPELKLGETYYCSLLARRKYCDQTKKIRVDNQMVKRFTSTKDYLLDKIKQLECPLGCYTSKHIPIPNEALALYINPNPRSHERAARGVMMKLAILNTKRYDGYDVRTLVMSEIQKACSRKVLINFDFDIEGITVYEVKQYLSDKINLDCVHFLMTRGGYHLLVETAKIKEQYKRTWYNKVIEIKGIDMQLDSMIPVPGCYQGSFVPYFYREVE